MSFLRARFLGIALFATACGGPEPITAIATASLTKLPGRWTNNVPTCGGDPLAGSFGIQAPTPPQLDTPPPGAVVVLDAVQLFDEVMNGIANDVVVMPGVYSAPPGYPAFLSLGAGDRIYASIAGHTVFRFGVSTRHAGAELHGIVIDIANVADAVPVGGGTNAAILGFDDARDLVVEDCWLRGNHAVERGIFVFQKDGLVVRRTEVNEFLRFGIVVATTVDSPFDPTVETRPLIQDVVVHETYDDSWPPSAAEAGREEFGIYVFVPATIQRAQVRRSGAGNIASGHNYLRVRNVQMIDVDVDVAGDAFNPGVGIYFEQGNELGQVAQFCVGPNTSRGVSVEWAHESPCPPTIPMQTCPPNPNIDNTFRYGFIDAQDVGVAVGRDAEDTRLYRLLIRGASAAGLVLDDLPGTAATDTTACGLGFELPPGVCRAYYDNYNTLPSATCHPVPVVCP